SGFCPGIENFPAHTRLLNAPLTAPRMHAIEFLRLERVLVLVLEEKREHILPTPPGIAELAPVVVIAGLPAHVDHAVDGGAATENLAARILQLAAIETGLADGLAAPIDPR